MLLDIHLHSVIPSVLWEELKDIFYGCLFILENVEKFLGWINPNPVQVPYLVVCPKKIVLRCTRMKFVIQFNVIMVPRVQQRYLLKTLNWTVDGGKIFKKTRKLREQGSCQGFWKIQIVIPIIMATNKKMKKGKWHTCRSQNIPQ